MTLVFGQSTAEFNQQATGQDSSTFTSNINTLVLYFVYIFVARFVIGYLGTLCICIAAARTTCALREDFLDKLLRQDVAHFDKGGSGSAATQVTTSKNLNMKVVVLLLTARPRWQQD
jgi:ATP-binding cassette subfamily B (MDR/TAP) protein 1